MTCYCYILADPNFYSTNLLMLGKTYLRMKNNKMALIYLQRTKEFPVKTPDDRKVRRVYITKTCLYNVDPLKPHCYILKLGFTGVYIILLISAQKHRLWVLIRIASPIYVMSGNMKKEVFI